MAENKQSVKFPKALVETLNEFAHIDKVWVNEQGEWSFHPRDGHSEFTADQVKKQSQDKK